MPTPTKDPPYGDDPPVEPGVALFNLSVVTYPSSLARVAATSVPASASAAVPTAPTTAAPAATATKEQSCLTQTMTLKMVVPVTARRFALAQPKQVRDARKASHHPPRDLLLLPVSFVF